MLQRIHRGFMTLANWPVIAVLSVGLIACKLGFDWRQTQLGADPPIPDIRFRGYTPGEILGLFEGWGADGRLLYARTQVTLDLAFPLLYGTSLAIAIAWLFRQGRWQWVVIVPVCAVLADLLENTTLAFLSWSFDGQASPLAWAAAVFTVSKFLLLGISVLLLVAGIVSWLRRNG